MKAPMKLMCQKVMYLDEEETYHESLVSFPGSISMEKGAQALRDRSIEFKKILKVEQCRMKLYLDVLVIEDLISQSSIEKN